MNILLSWKRKKNDGFGCEALYAGTIRIGGYAHTMVREDPRGEFIGFIDLPSAKNLCPIQGTRKQVKRDMIEIFEGWIKQVTSTEEETK